jgi:hypothetical protein
MRLSEFAARLRHAPTMTAIGPKLKLEQRRADVSF